MNYYSPHTGEFIETSSPASWMGKTESALPAFDRTAQSCFFRDGTWVVVDAPIADNPRIAEIKALLVDLDMKRIRPLAECDAEYIAILNTEVVALRAELTTLTTSA